MNIDKNKTRQRKCWSCDNYHKKLTKRGLQKKNNAKISFSLTKTRRGTVNLDEIQHEFYAVLHSRTSTAHTHTRSPRILTLKPQ